MTTNLPVVDAEDFMSQFGSDGKPTRPFEVRSGTWLSHERVYGITSLNGVVFGSHINFQCPSTLTTLDGLDCADRVCITDYGNLHTLGNLVLGDYCRLRGLTSVRHLGTLKCGRRCVLDDLQDPVELGTPKLTADEMQIIRQIDIKQLGMELWHYDKPGCGTVHCLAGWAEVIKTKKHDAAALEYKADHFDDASLTSDIGNRLLPNLSHLFYAQDASESVREMIKRLQALPE